MRAFPVVLSLLFVTVAAIAQEPPPSPTFAEQIVVRVIDVDVVVTDKQGRPITGLTREDFELLEDGKPVEIKYFSGVSTIGAPKPAPSGAEVSPAAPVIAALPNEKAPITWVVFIDQTNMHPGRRNRTLRHLHTFLNTALAQGDRGIIASNDGLALRLRQSLTNDRTALLETLKKLEKERVHQGPAGTRASQIRHDIRDAQAISRNPLALGTTQEPTPVLGSDDPEFAIKGIYIGSQISVVIEEEAQRTRNAIRAMGALVDVLAGVEGRLALVYVGAGFNTLPGLELTETWRNRFNFLAQEAGAPRPEDHKVSLEQEVTRLYTNLSATRVTVYTIHAGGVSGPSAEDPGILTSQGEVPGDRSSAYEAGLAREMAQRTGGLYFKVNPDLVKQLDAVRVDLSHYYSLGYVPQGPPGDQRRIKVRVKTEGARVRHREAVRERTRPEERDRVEMASLVQPTAAVAKRIEGAPISIVPTETNPLGVKVQTARPQRDGWGKDHLLPFNLQLGSLTFVPKGKVHRAEFVLHFALVEPDGTVWQVESREHSLEIPANEMPKGDEQMSFRWHVDLKPLRLPPQIPIRTEGMKLNVTVEDRASHVRSVITVPVQKPGHAFFGQS